MTWTGTFYNQQLIFEGMTLHVNQVRKGRWYWSLTRPQYMVGGKGKVRKESTTLDKGFEGCRKVALNEVLAAGARVDVRLWGGRKRIGGHVRV